MPAGEQLGEVQGGRVACCNRAQLLWDVDDLLTAANTGRRLPTDVIDRMPPLRAWLVAQVCLRAGSSLEHGDEVLLERAAREAGRKAPRASGWWRAALGLPPPGPDGDPPGRNQRPRPSGGKAGNLPTR